jgi:tetratricopeptide (TPR) repeat protein
VPARSAAPAAFDEYLKGRSLFAKRLGDNIPLAIQAYDRALALGPDFGPAHSARAFAYAIAPGFSSAIPVDEASTKALAGAERALELDPDNAEAYLVRGTVRSYHSARPPLASTSIARWRSRPATSMSSISSATTCSTRATCGAAERLKRQAMALDPLAFVHPTTSRPSCWRRAATPKRSTTRGARWRWAADGSRQRDLLNAQLRVRDIEGARASAQAICAELGPDDAVCMAVEVLLHGADGDQAAYARSAGALPRGDRQPRGTACLRPTSECRSPRSRTTSHRHQGHAQGLPRLRLRHHHDVAARTETARACPRRSAPIRIGSRIGPGPR